MTEAQDAFRSLVRDYLTSLGETVSDTDAADDYLLEAGGRILQLRLGDDGTMILSTMAFYNEGAPERVLEVPIAEFNAYHLFAGGYRLLVDERSGSLYVEQTLTAGRLDVARLRRHLHDFADRATSCARWYLKQLPEREDPMPPRREVFA